DPAPPDRRELVRRMVRGLERLRDLRHLGDPGRIRERFVMARGIGGARRVAGLLLAALLCVPGIAEAQDRQANSPAGGPLLAEAPAGGTDAEGSFLRAPPDALDAGAEIGAAIEVDGIPDEEAWLSARVFTGFTQREPVEGVPAEHDTEVRVLFGDGAIWIAARMWDPEPLGIVARLDRRDSWGQSDEFGIHLDPDVDGLTGYMFAVTAANVQRDAYLYDDGQMDNAWDAIWSSAVRIGPDGWTAEMRIPLSQIRYQASAESQTWGVNFFRNRTATNEDSHYSLISRLRPGRVSQMALMDGVRVARPSRRLEVLPYVVSSLHRGPSE